MLNSFWTWAEKWCIPILFFILPFAFVTPGLIWKSQQLFFIFMGVFIAAVGIKNQWVKLFILYASIWQVYIFLSIFNKGISPGNGLSIILCLLSGGFVYKFVSESSLPRASWLYVIRAVVIIQLVIGLMQYFGVNPVPIILSYFTQVKEGLPTHIVGTLGNRNFIAAMTAISLPLFIGWRAVTFYRINFSIVILFVFLILCPSPGSLAGIIGSAIYLIYKKDLDKKLFYIALSGVIAVCFAAAYILTTGNHISEFTLLTTQWREIQLGGDILTETAPGDVGRFGMWMLAGSKLLSDPVALVLGFGPGAFWGRGYPLHSEYVSVAHQFGIIGIILLIGFIVTTFKGLVRRKDAQMISAFSIICLDMVGNFPVEVASTAFLIIIVCGLIERDRLQEIRGKT